MSKRTEQIREAAKQWGYAWTLGSDDIERSTLSAEDTQLVVKAALEYADLLDTGPVVASKCVFPLVKEELLVYPTEERVSYDH